MPYQNAQEQGKPVAIKDEGITLVSSVGSIDFVGAGVTGSAIGADVTENIPGGGGGGGSVDSVVAGTGISVDSTDPANPIVSSTITQYTDENAQDAVGGILTDSSTVDFTYDDVANTITATVPDGSISNAKVASGIDAAKIGGGAVSNAEYSYLDGVTSAIQTQLDGKVDENGAITGATKTKITYDAKGLVTSGSDATTADIADSTDRRYVTDAQLTVVGNTSGTNTGDQNLFSTIAVSGQSNVVADSTSDTLTIAAGTGITITTNATTDTVTIAASGGGGTGDVVGPASATDNAIPRYDGTTGKLIQDSNVTIADVTGDMTAGKYNGNTIGAGSTSGTNTGDQTITLTGDVTGSGTGSFATAIAAGAIVDADINASAAIAVTKLAAVTASRALASDVSGFVTPSATTSTELGYVSGVTSAIQTQINAKQATITGAATTIASSNLTASRAAISNASGKVDVSATTDTELGYVSGVTSAIQTQLNAKQATITGAATTIATSNLTASKALASDASGKVVASTVTDTELGYVSGVTSAIQTQLNGKQASGTYVTSVSGTASRITSSGGTTPAIDISATFEALLAKIANRIDQNNASTTSAQLASIISDETGSGALVFATSPTLVTPTLGVASATSINKVAITAPATSATLTIANGKTLTASNSITLAGTDSTTMTFPSTTATIARTDAAQTFTGTQTFSQVITTANAITATSNAATIPVTSKHNKVTNNSAATLTITLTTTSAVDMQVCIVQVLDFSAATQTITWVNTENSTATAPTTSNGSTTLPLTVGFMYNASTSKWRCIASA